MRIAVVGLGGVGAYIGAKLCALKDEHEIVFIARAESLKKIQKNGLRLIDVDNEEVYFPTAALERTSEHLDIIFLCTKSYQFEEAIKQISSAISDKTLIIPISNGVDNCDLIKPLTPAKLINACVYIVSHKVSAAVVKKTTDVFALVLPEEVQELLQNILDKAGLRCKFSSDIKKEIWKKFLFISSMGTMTSYYNIGMGAVYKEHKEEFCSLLHEISSIARTQGVLISSKEIDKTIHTASILPLDAPTSLWLDIKNNRQNELKSLCYYVIQKAQENQLSVPVMQKIYKKLGNKIPKSPA